MPDSTGNNDWNVTVTWYPEPNVCCPYINKCTSYPWCCYDCKHNSAKRDYYEPEPYPRPCPCPPYYPWYPEYPYWVGDPPYQPYTWWTNDNQQDWQTSSISVNVDYYCNEE